MKEILTKREWAEVAEQNEQNWKKVLFWKEQAKAFCEKCKHHSYCEEYELSTFDCSEVDEASEDFAEYKN